MGRRNLTDPWGIHAAWADGFVLVNVPVTDLDVETATGVDADPSFIVD